MTASSGTKTPPDDFQVVIEATGETVAVAKDQSILGALENAGFYVPWMCRSGFCGTCVVGVVAGTPDHRGTVVKKGEPSANSRVALCVSRSLTPQLVISLG
jgi:vanillate O-demethylase ferredoxin subunit